MTFDPDMWPLTSSTNEGTHIVPMTQLWLKSIKSCGSIEPNVNLFSKQQQTTITTTTGDKGILCYVSFLLRQATQKCNSFAPVEWLESHIVLDSLVKRTLFWIHEWWLVINIAYFVGILLGPERNLNQSRTLNILGLNHNHQAQFGTKHL